jgi:hypothetical protein
MKDTPPCKDCICLATCRHKLFYELLGNCELLYYYDRRIIDRYNRNVDKLMAIQDTLKPTTWKYTLQHPERVHGRHIVTTKGIHTLGREDNVRRLYAKMPM